MLTAVVGVVGCGSFESIVSLLVPWVNICSMKVLIGRLIVSNAVGYATSRGEVGQVRAEGFLFKMGCGLAVGHGLVA